MGQVVHTSIWASEHWGSESQRGDNVATPSKEAIVQIWTEAKQKSLLNLHLPHHNFLLLQKRH